MNFQKILYLIKKFFRWLALLWSGFMIKLSIALYNSEELILKNTAVSLNGDAKHTIRVRHRNKLAEKLLQGQRDEKFVKDFYEVLKKADDISRNMNAQKAEMLANKHGMSKRGKDKWGRRYDHYGFFDPTSKHYGKSVREVLELEVDERKSKDDDYEVEIMFNNKPVIEGLAKAEPLSLYEQAKKAKFPMKVIHNKENPVNRIEQLTEFLHVKRLGEIDKILEFFIPVKYKIFDLSENNDIFKEIIDIKQVWIFDEYGTRYGYSVDKYTKRVEYSDKNDDIIYHIIKFRVKKIENFYG